MDLIPAVELKEVVVSAEKVNRIEESTQMSTISVPIEQIRRLPAALGEVDVLRTLQLLPGVQKRNEGSTGLYVRGGSPDQNLMLLDGVPLYNVSHLGGMFSVFNSDAISQVSLIKGGYPARYGGRLSSVLDVRMRDGNLKEWHGQASIGLVSTRLALEGPIRKDRTSFMVSGRRTYLDLFSRPISKMATNGVASVGYHFYDLNAKVNHILSNRSRLYLSFYGGDDKFIARTKDTFGDAQTQYTSKGKSRLLWGNLLTSLRWNHILNEKLFFNSTLHYSRYRYLVDMAFEQSGTDGSGEKAYFGYFSGIEDWSGKWEAEYYPLPRHSVRFGAQGIYHTFRPGVSAFRANDQTERTDTSFGSSNVRAWETAVYAEDDWEITSRLKANAGLHFSTFLLPGQTYNSLQPRLALRYLLPGQIALKASYATMQQYLHLLTNSDTDLPTDLWVPATERVKPQWSEQTAVGVAKSLRDNTYEVSLEGYYRGMKNLIDYQEGATFPGSTTDWQENVTTGGKGESYGAEVLLQKKQGKLGGWVGYTLSWTNRQFADLNNGRPYPFRYDRRHDVGVALTYQRNAKVSFSASWMYGTGNAITLGVARYPAYSENRRRSFYWQNDIEVYEGRNGYRMRSYHKLDFGVSFHKKKKRTERDWNISVYNAYNRQNPFYYFVDYDYGRGTGDQRVLKQMSLFPLIPAASYTVKF